MTYYDSTTVVFIERSEGVITPHLVVDFGGEIQIIYDGLTQREGCTLAAVTSYLAVGIIEKWWPQHMRDFDDGAT